MRATVMGISRVDGVVPNIERRDALGGKTRLKFDAWCSGVEDSFSRDSRKTYQASRLKVQRATGIDVMNALTSNIQRRSFLSVRELFREGLRCKHQLLFADRRVVIREQRGHNFVRLVGFIWSKSEAASVYLYDR